MHPNRLQTYRSIPYQDLGDDPTDQRLIVAARSAISTLEQCHGIVKQVSLLATKQKQPPPITFPRLLFWLRYVHRDLMVAFQRQPNNERRDTLWDLGGTIQSIVRLGVDEDLC